MRLADHLRPGPLDIAAGFLIGQDEKAPHLPAPVGCASPIAVLETVVRPLVARPPCLVSFSGGRDSSAMLALATDVARREGLPLPVPATVVYPEVAEAEETSWQELVVAHLGLEDWYRVEVHGELSALGPFAVAALRRHGLLWPTGAYAALPLLRAARAGSFITGHGGDEVFTSRGSRVVRVLAGTCRPRPRDLVRFGLAMSPAVVQQRVAFARDRTPYPWLRAEGVRRVKRAVADWSSRIPGRWDQALDSWWRSRDLQACHRALPLLAEGLDVLVLHPLADPRVLVALQHMGGPVGFPSRTAAMRSLFGHLLPEAVLSRSSKARFDGSVWGEETASFARSWHGGGLDPELVDQDVLREMWQSPTPDARTMLLLQSAWLAR